MGIYHSLELPGINKGESGLGKKEILIKLKRIRQNINNNL